MIIKLKPVFKDYLWGGNNLTKLFGKQSNLVHTAESWELSVHKDGLSTISGGVYEGLTLCEYLEKHPQALGKAGKMSIMIKLIDATEKLSVQVHPNDFYAKQFNDNGKTEIWYVLQAEKDAEIYCGFSRNTSKNEVYELIEENKIETVLNAIPVHSGEIYQIEAGTVHAVGRGIVLVEVQQSSNLTYRLYDYGRTVNGNKRQLHIQQALEALNYGKFSLPSQPKPTETRLLCRNQYFSCYEYNVKAEKSLPASEVYGAVVVIEGNPLLNGIYARAGDTFFIGAYTEVNVSGFCKLLATYPNIK